VSRGALGLLALLALAAGVALLAAPRAGPVARPLALPGAARPLVVAHRGGALLWPENTIHAFERAADLGADMLEMDLRATADGVLVVLHDETVDRTTDGTGPVRGLPLEALRRLDAGHRWSPDGGRTFPLRGAGLTVPTLGEVLQALPGTPMTLEIKQRDPSLAAALCETVRAHGAADRVLVASFHDAEVRAFRRLCPEAATSATAGEARRFVLLSKALPRPPYTPPAQALQLPERLGSLHVITPRLVRAAHRRGLQVHAWTIDEEQDMRRLLGLGVDGIITDRPDRLLEVLGRPRGGGR
jgi:glycerophosphoryl diester phosphodiesterase